MLTGSIIKSACVVCSCRCRLGAEGGRHGAQLPDVELGRPQRAAAAEVALDGGFVDVGVGVAGDEREQKKACVAVVHFCQFVTCHRTRKQSCVRKRAIVSFVDVRRED